MNIDFKNLWNNILNKIRPFYFSSKELKYKRMNGWLLLVILFFSSTTFYIGWTIAEKHELENIKNYEAEERLVIIKNGDKFSEDKLILFIKELNFKWPEIVYSQARIESGENFDSDVNIQNNNYFGMKKANVRINTQTGENLEHAVYLNWRMSVLDYSLYSATYLHDFKTKSEYYNYIEKMYSTTPGYVTKVMALEKEYFEKLAKITAKNSYDIFEQETNDSVQIKHKQIKSNVQSINGDSIVENVPDDSLKN
jgi:hypothetical protein